MKTVEFREYRGVIQYRCLTLYTEDEFDGNNSDGEPTYKRGVIQLGKYTEWEDLPTLE